MTGGSNGRRHSRDQAGDGNETCRARRRCGSPFCNFRREYNDPSRGSLRDSSPKRTTGPRTLPSAMPVSASATNCATWARFLIRSTAVLLLACIIRGRHLPVGHARQQRQNHRRPCYRATRPSTAAPSLPVRTRYQSIHAWELAYRRQEPVWHNRESHRGAAPAGI